MCNISALWKKKYHVMRKLPVDVIWEIVTENSRVFSGRIPNLAPNEITRLFFGEPFFPGIMNSHYNLWKCKQTTLKKNFFSKKRYYYHAVYSGSFEDIWKCWPMTKRINWPGWFRPNTQCVQKPLVTYTNVNKQLHKVPKVV